MASRSVVRRGVTFLRSTVSHSARRAKLDGLCAGGFLKSQTLLGVRSTSLQLNKSLFKQSLKTYTTAVAMVPQLQGNTSPLALLTNVDVRNLSIGSPGSLSEAGTEDDDEQNCLPQSGIIHTVQKEMLKSECSGQIFAIVHIGGSQFKITVNDTIIINRIDAETGDRIRIEKVLLVGGENFTVIGTPLLARNLVTIEATVVEKTKAPKVIVFKKKRRKGYKRTQGHRQDITVLRINCIQVQPSLLSSTSTL